MFKRNNLFLSDILKEMDDILTKIETFFDDFNTRMFKTFKQLQEKFQKFQENTEVKTFDECLIIMNEVEDFHKTTRLKLKKISCSAMTVSVKFSCCTYSESQKARMIAPVTDGPNSTRLCCCSV